MARSFVTVLIEAGLACLVDVVPRGDAHRSSTRRDAYCLKFYELRECAQQFGVGR